MEVDAMMTNPSWLLVGAAILTMQCSTGDGSVGMSAAKLAIEGDPVNYTPAATFPSPQVPSTNTVLHVSKSNACHDPATGQSTPATVVAWQVDNVDDNGVTPTYWSITCDAASTPAQTYQVTAANVDDGTGDHGIPPGWGSDQIVYDGSPTLVDLGAQNSNGEEWIAMILYVGPVYALDNPTTPTAVAVLLSQDGGYSFAKPNLISDVAGGINDAGGERYIDGPLKYLAATSTFQTDSSGLELATNGIFATWRRVQTSHNWVRYVGYEQNSITDAYIGYSSLSEYDGPGNVFERNIVAGNGSSAEDDQQFAFILGAGTSNDEATDCSSGDPAATIEQVWHGWASQTYGAEWGKYEDGTVESAWPRCIGGNRNTAYATGGNYFRNSARPALALDETNYGIIYGVPRVTDKSYDTHISVEGCGISFTPCDGGACGPTQQVVTPPDTVTFPGPDNGNNGRSEDQWQPTLVIEADGTRYLSWVDTGGSNSGGVGGPTYPKPTGYYGKIFAATNTTWTLFTEMYPSGSVSPYFMNDDGTVVGDLGDYHGAAIYSDYQHTFLMSLADGWAAHGSPAVPFGVFSVIGYETSP